MTPRKKAIRTTSISRPFVYVADAPIVRRFDYEIAKPAVFLDRDGTLMEETGYCSDPQLVRSFPGAVNGLLRLRNAGFLTIIITNQSGIGRGLFSLEDFEKVHMEFLSQIGPSNIDATYFCADHPENASHRRKPGIGMIDEAVRDLHIDLTRSWFIGDKAIDIACGKAAGLRTILVSTGYGSTEECQPDHFVPDLATAVDWIVVE